MDLKKWMKDRNFSLRIPASVCLLFFLNLFLYPPQLSTTDVGIEITLEDDLTVSGADGTAPDPDIGIKGFSVFGSTQSAYTGAVIGLGNVVINGYLSVSSGSYFVGNSTFPGAGNIFINDGTTGQALQKTALGNLTWVKLLDNLGNHIATTTLGMADFDIVNVATITVSSITTTTAGVVFSTNVFVTQGNVGLGTTQPGAKLDVAGRVKMTEFQLGVSTPAGYLMTADSSGVGTWQSDICYLHVRDEKALNTTAGDAASAWQTRTLNTVVANTIPGASLTNSTITLPAGTYRVYARAPAYASFGNNHYLTRIKFATVDDATVKIIGSNMDTVYNNYSSIYGYRFTITAQNTFILRHWFPAAKTDGLGLPANDGSNVEIYSVVFIIRE